MPYDLSDGSGSNQTAPTTTGSGPPSVGPRPSDILRGGGGGPGGMGQGPRGGHAPEPFFLSERPITPADGAVSTILWFAVIAMVLSLLYLLYGVWTGMLANPHFIQLYAKADQARILGDLALAETILRWSMLISLISLVFLYYDEESIGYILVITAVFLSVGIPDISGFLLGLNKAKPSVATWSVIDAIKALSFYPAVPGTLLIVWDLVRRAISGLEAAKNRRAGLRYGQGAAAQIKRRNVFLGRCWNMPYCRDSIRARCPIQIKHQGPCWRYKQGCMCEESIAVLATTAGDWKSAVSKAITNLESRETPDSPAPKTGNPLLAFSDGSGRPQLSWNEKKQRCRECLIYNTHQEQKYKALTAGVFVLIAAILYFCNGPLINILAAVFDKFNSSLGQLSLVNNHGSQVLSASASTPVCWFVLCVIAILALSKLLQMVEYCCFTLKI